MKKGDLSMNYVIIAAIALIVLVVIILFFTGGLQTLFKQQSEIVSGATDQQLEIWRGQCKLYCSLGQKENFLGKVFKSGDGSSYACSTTPLSVACEKCSGVAAGCFQYKDSKSCGDAKCTWESWGTK